MCIGTPKRVNAHGESIQKNKLKSYEKTSIRILRVVGGNTFLVQ
jgi:hypothetical protein